MVRTKQTFKLCQNQEFKFVIKIKLQPAKNLALRPILATGNTYPQEELGEDWTMNLDYVVIQYNIGFKE